MQMQTIRFRAFAFAASIAVLAFSGWASADPPSRVARIGYLGGMVSFSPAGENDWVRAVINRPLTTGDRLWTDAGARAEIQVGGAVIRMNADTGVSVLNLDDRITQLQLMQGTLNVRVRRFAPNQVFEVDTPNLAFTLRQPGEYRITVDPSGDTTDVIVRKGQGEVYGEGAAYVVDSRQSYRFSGTGLGEYRYVDAPRLDEFDRWASDRDRGYENSVSARYVSQDVVGYQDLDANGTWRVDANYGNVWVPNRVVAGWAPYRDGHWAWIDPWGWTWVDDAPWGFAVSHYGRWANLRGTWGWVPGPVRSQAYYAPALVAFVGGSNFQLSISSGNVGGVAWFPLGPREVYRPSYPVSRGYFERVNVSNTVVNTTVVNNYYNNTNVTNVVYVNRQVPGAVVAVPTTAFVQSQPVAKSAVRVSREVVERVPVAFVAPVVPTERSVRGAAAQGDRPPSRVFERSAVARTAPPPAAVGFAAQQQQLTANPGQPLDAANRRELKREATAPAPDVKVISQKQQAPSTLRPPPAAAVAAQPADQRGGPDKRVREDQRGQAVAPAPAAPPVVASPAPTAQPEQRGRPDKRAQEDQRGQAAAPAPAAPPVVASPAPAAQPPEQRGRPDKRAQGDQRGQAVAPPPARAEVVAAPAAVAQPPEQRGRPDRRAQEDKRGQAAAPPPTAPPVLAAPAPAAQMPDQRGRPDKRVHGDQRGQAAAAPPPPRQAAAPAPSQIVAAPVPKADPGGKGNRPDAGTPKDKKKDGDEQRPEEENRKR